jgi:hypothetical protein
MYDSVVYWQFFLISSKINVEWFRLKTKQLDLASPNLVIEEQINGTDKAIQKKNGY